MTAAPLSPLLVPQPYRVLDSIEEGPGICTLRVAPVSGTLPSFEPAQVSMLGVFGVGEAAVSISSAVGETEFHAYTIRRAGAITNALLDTPVGGVITVRGPFGNRWPLADVTTKNLAVVAGGLGVAPLRSAMHAIVDQLGRFDRVAFLYGAKSPADLIYNDEFDQWRHAGIDVVVTVDAGDDDWTGPVGLVPDLLGDPAGIDVEWSDTTVLLCGPDVMMHVTAAKLLRLGVPAERIWMTLERNMQCGNALCGHCQLGPFIVCRDGPVASYAEIGPFHRIKEL